MLDRMLKALLCAVMGLPMGALLWAIDRDRHSFLAAWLFAAIAVAFTGWSTPGLSDRELLDAERAGLRLQAEKRRREREEREERMRRWREIR